MRFLASAMYTQIAAPCAHPVRIFLPPFLSRRRHVLEPVGAAEDRERPGGRGQKPDGVPNPGKIEPVQVDQNPWLDTEGYGSLLFGVGSLFCF